ncbi:MAG: exopolysaccharide biosynthesis protein [Actinomycetota bacterium]|nr:exopolysaccharide biosynthesis protein [Actinomycetota bacterium]
MDDVAAGEKVSAQLEDWLSGKAPKTVGSLIDVFGQKSFGIVFVVLMALPALPVPTGAASHVLEVITMLLALELLVGRREIWLPDRWKGKELAGGSRKGFATRLLRFIRWFERFSRRRLPHLFRHRLSGAVFGALVLVLSATAFLAPPFSGLDTLPALGVVALSLGVVLEDFLLAAAGVVVGAIGAVLVVGLGGAVVRWLGN